VAPQQPAPLLLPAVRDLYSRLPETYFLAPWELVHLLYSLGYTDDLADEDQVAAAAAVAREDGQWQSLFWDVLPREAYKEAS
jgi:hypothetical protein